jgi:haloalkane dehalogenase
MGDATPAVQGDTRVGQASVHWRMEGSGSPIVFVHGFPLSGDTWNGVVARLRERFTCYAPDLIGLGQSHSRADEDYSSTGQACVLQRTLSDLGVPAYALVGNDTGGWIARELALIDRERVSHLVLTNTEIPFHRPPWIPLYQLLAHVPGCGSIFQLLLRSRRFRRSPLAFGGCFHDLSYLDGTFHQRFVVPLIGTQPRIEGVMKFLRRMKFVRLDEFKTLHRELTIPTLFIWGADDPTFPEARARDMANQFPDVTAFHSIGKAKLFFYEEQPQEVARLIEGFVGTRDRAT